MVLIVFTVKYLNVLESRTLEKAEERYGHSPEKGIHTYAIENIILDVSEPLWSQSIFSKKPCLIYYENYYLVPLL